MNKTSMALCLGLAALVSCSGPKEPTPVPPTGHQDKSSGDYTISGPYVHANLAVYLVHGEDRHRGRNFLTLQEALERKKIIIHETSDVQKLAVENISEDDAVYIQAGDIVRGGKQDRVLTIDLIVSAKSGKTDIDSFCVERGRWQGRGAESSAYFSASSNTVPSNSTKLAMRVLDDQEKVWGEVAAQQEAIGVDLYCVVRDDVSPTSLELTLEHDKVKAAVADYTRDLGKIIDEHNDAVGTVVVINGKLNCADVYGSNQLFKKLWPKMLKASAIEAISEHDLSRTTEPPAIEAVHAFLSNAEGGKSRAQEVSSRITCVTKETNDNILFETIDKKGKTGWVHRSYLNKVYKGREDAQPPSTGNANSVQGQMPDIEPED